MLKLGAGAFKSVAEAVRQQTSAHKISRSSVSAVLAATKPSSFHEVVGHHTQRVVKKSSTLSKNPILDCITVVAEGLGVNKAVFGIPLPSTFAPVFEAAKSNILTAEELENIRKSFDEMRKLQIKKFLKSYEFTGLAVVLDEDKTINEASRDQAKNAQVIVTTGLGGSSNSGRLAYNAGALQKLFSTPSLGVVIYVPLLEGLRQEERYINGSMLYAKEEFINEEESLNFFKKILEDRLVGADRKLISAEKFPRFILLSHSIGAREAASHMRWLKKYLTEHDVSEEDVAKYLGKILRVNIASPLTRGSESALSPEVSFVSLNDSGSKKPEEFFRDIYLNPNLYQHAVTKLSLGNGSQCDILCVLGPGVVPNGGLRKDGTVAADPFGHAARTHVEAILDNPETFKILESCRRFADPAISDEKAQLALKDILENAQPYPKNRAIDSEGAKLLLASWRDHMVRESLAPTAASVVESVCSTTRYPNTNITGGPLR